MEEDHRRLVLQQERREQKARAERFRRTGQREPKKNEAQGQDLFRDLKKRARLHSQPAPATKIEISHLGRQRKNQMLYDKQR